MHVRFRSSLRAACVGITLLIVGIGLSPAEAGEERPNIVLMLSDDQSWSGLSVAMHPDLDYSKSDVVQTPQIAKLASEGMRFSAAYAPAPVCSPTRIALQTGRSPAVLHWTKAGPSVGPAANHKLIGPRNIRAIASDETTIGELLKSAGYRTAHFGKWHLRGGGPGAHGYDVHDGDLGNEHAAKFEDPNPVDIFGMTERAIAFMKASKSEGKPFFVQMSWHALHAPENAMKATLAKYQGLVRGGRSRQVARAAIAEDLDTGVGRLLAALDALDLTKTTYVIYTSDNGGGGGGRGRSARGRPRRARGLTGGKGSLSEGGIRVPFIVRGPSVAPNSWCHVPVTGLDLLPTFAAWAGLRRLPKGVEGGDIATLLLNEGKGAVVRPREELVFHFPHYQDERGPQSSILLGSLKLLKCYEDGCLRLYDLSKDPSEQNDLAEEMPEKAAELEARLATYLRSVEAQMPSPNPLYDPDRAPASRKDPPRRR